MSKKKPVEMVPTFGQRLVQLLAEAEITRYRLAKQTGLDQSYLGRLETGKQSPSLRSARLIAQAFGHGLAIWDETRDE